MRKKLFISATFFLSGPGDKATADIYNVLFLPPRPHSPRPWPPASWSVFLPSEATQTFIFEGYEFFFSPVVFEHNK